jgi:drug/metabolite transporter (DMT)-like permease
MAAARSRRATGFAFAFAGAVAFSGKAIVAKLLYRQGIDAVTAVGLRMLLAWPFFLLMAWWAGRGKKPLSAQDWLRVTILGVTGYYLASMLDFAGLQYISASLERLILYVYPTVVLLIGLVRGRHDGSGRIHRAQWLALGVSYAGVLLAFGSEAAASLHERGAQVPLGAALVLGSAISYAVYLVLSGETVARFGSLRLTGLASSLACALCVVQYFVLRPAASLATLPPAVWHWSIVNATLCTLLPMWMVMRAMELIGSGPAAQVGMVGPVSTLVLAVVVLGEPFTPTMAAGTLLVLAGVALLARARAALNASRPAS